jgi:hypothetical protein
MAILSAPSALLVGHLDQPARRSQRCASEHPPRENSELPANRSPHAVAELEVPQQNAQQCSARFPFAGLRRGILWGRAVFNHTEQALGIGHAGWPRSRLVKSSTSALRRALSVSITQELTSQLLRNHTQARIAPRYRTLSNCPTHAIAPRPDAAAALDWRA